MTPIIQLRNCWVFHLLKSQLQFDDFFQLWITFICSTCTIYNFVYSSFVVQLLFCRRHLFLNFVAEKISKTDILRGRSQTTLTWFWLLLTTYPPALTFFMVWTLTKSGHFCTTYLPCLVNVVCEQPLIQNWNYTDFRLRCFSVLF